MKTGTGQRKHIDGILLGYEENSKAYRVWDIKERKIKSISFYFLKTWASEACERERERAKNRQFFLLSHNLYTRQKLFPGALCKCCPRKNLHARGHHHVQELA